MTTVERQRWLSVSGCVAHDSDEDKFCRYLEQRGLVRWHNSTWDKHYYRLTILGAVEMSGGAI